MAVTLRGTTASNTASITIPAATQPGDLIFINAGHYFEQIGTTSPADQGFTAYGNINSTKGTYADYHRLYYKWADANDAGRVVNIVPMAYPQYGGITCAVLAGCTRIIVANAATGGDTYAVPTGAVTPDENYYAIAFYSQMGNTATIPGWTVPSPLVAIMGVAGTGGYHITGCVWNPNEVQANVTSDLSLTSDQLGSNTGIVVTVDTGGPPPPVDPTITPETVDAATFTTPGYSIQVRVTDPDSTSLTVEFETAADANFTTSVNSTVVGVSGPANNELVTRYPTATDGTRYWRARVSDEQATSAWTETRSFTVDLPVESFYLGSDLVEGLFVGEDLVSELYLGETLVWEAPPEPSELAGVIAMFDNATLPDGWFACNGTNGTPDLRDRFVVGAGLGYTAGDIGGANAVTVNTAQLPSHNHNVSSGSGGAHSHSSSSVSSANTHNHSTTIGLGDHSHGYVGYGNMANFVNQMANYVSTQGTSAANTGNATEAAHSTATSSTSGLHTHIANQSGYHGHSGSTNSTGSGSSHENRPPYYALIYAMATEASLIVDGMIAMSDEAAIEGWALCNGTAAQPDLRDRFVVGAGLTYSVGAIGGANTVALSNTTMPAHSHGLNVSYDNAGHAHNMSNSGTGHSHDVNLSAHSAHTHGYSRNNAATLTIGGSGTAVRSGPNVVSSGSGKSNDHSLSFATATDNHAHNSSNSDGSHSHSVSGGTTGSGTAHENRPPYRALNFIRKVGAGEAIGSGVIVGFHGAEIPDGWTLCDGTDAPDLRERFVVGAGSAYAVNDIGGQNSVVLAVSEMASHNHNGSINSEGSHSHSLASMSESHSHTGSAPHNANHTHGNLYTSNSGTTKTGGNAIAGMTSVITRQTNNYAHGHNITNLASNETHSHSMTANTDHTHSMGMDNVGSGDGHENRPPYYALAFIQKL